MICPLSCDDLSCLRCCAFPVRRSTTRLPQPPDTLGKIVDDYWRHELDDNVASQIKFGIPTHHLPDVSYAHAQWER